MSGAFSDFLTHVGAAQVLPDKPPNLPAAAMYYAQVLGWSVFPLKPRGKAPLIGKAHPDNNSLQGTCRRACGRDGHGLHDATTDLERVRAWWERTPDANIGLPTGLRELGGIGFDVIDADGPEGVAAWMELKHRNCEGCSKEAFCNATGGFNIACESFTPGNSTVGKGPGRHVYVPASPNTRNDARVGGKPIDVRASGGYVLAVPSVNLVGAAYTWLTPPKVVRP